MYIVLCAFCFLFYMTERFNLAKCVYLKRSEDIYLHELVSPLTSTLKFVYLCKIIVCVCTFVFIEGNGQHSQSSLWVIMQYGFQYGIQIYGLFLAQLCVVLILLIFGSMPCLSSCLAMDRNKDQS